MGILDGFASDFGFGSSSGEDAARKFKEEAEKAIKDINSQFQDTKGNLQPSIDLGLGQLPALQQGTTAQGLDERLATIFGSDNFQNLRDERTRALQGQLGAGGLTRSGTALQEIADVPTQLGFALEELLTGRSRGLASSGQNAAVNLGQFGANAQNSIAGLRTGIGLNNSSGFLADRQSEAAGRQNLLDLGGSIFGGVSGGDLFFG